MLDHSGEVLQYDLTTSGKGELRSYTLFLNALVRLRMEYDEHLADRPVPDPTLE